MKFLKKNLERLSEIIFFGAAFILAIKPLRDFDIWFHIKSGEIIAQLGIIHYDVFSNSATGREWFPYEWLFQILVYANQQLLGFDSIKYTIAVVALLQMIVFYLLLRKIFRLSWLWSILTTFFYYAFIFDFIVARPHIVAYTLLLINLSLIYLYFFRSKNWLWLTIPVTLIWANLHGSIFLDIAFFAGYSVISFIIYLMEHNMEWRKKSFVLGAWAIGTGLFTILPPLGFLQYRLLWIFFLQQNFISKVIDEWTPLSLNPVGFYIYTVFVVLIGVFFVIQCIKEKRLSRFLWIIPLLPLIILPYSATRNVYLGGIALSLILGWCLTKLQFKTSSKKLKMLVIGVALLVTIFNGVLIYLKDNNPPLYYPVKAAQFIKQYALQGNMFNEYGYGGYLLYQLYPDHKVFIDGRTDVYLCCELKDTFDIAVHKTLPDQQFSDLLYRDLWDKYHISYVLLRTEKHTLIRKITRLLDTDPNWSLVFWDDYTQLFIRKDGKNDDVIRTLGTTYATPYLQDPFPSGKGNQALTEYERMETVAKSGHTSNVIGYIELQKGQFDDAKKRFDEAIAIDPLFESPYMNLAELAVRDGDYYTAILLYKQAQKLAMDRGLIYIRLGQLYIEGYHDGTEAKKIWQLGIKQTVDTDAIKQMQQLLNTIK